MSAPAAGYSGTPLVRKLGYRDGQRAHFVGVPEALRPALGAPAFVDSQWLAIDGPWPCRAPVDVAHVFVDRQAALADALPRIDAALEPDGMIWVSWPKKASKVPTDVTEDVIRELALPLDLVDVKVCAVDQTWSGLKLVIRKEKR
ncbi:MAG: DUF3052 family protein [Caldilineaceae bacterium]|nr:DUF3052 family protein [Caldilineaceae bacterium]